MEPAKSRCSWQVGKRRFAPRLTSARRQTGGERGRKKARNPPEQGAKNAAKTEMRPRTERHAAKIREFENKGCQTSQAVKVWHPRTENWQGSERSTRDTSKKEKKKIRRLGNTRNSRVARGDLPRTMRPRMRKIFRRLTWCAIVNKIFANQENIRSVKDGCMY